MSAITAIHRYLDPGETLAEVLFGLIMALTIISGAELFTAPSELNTHELIVAVVGCNLAWGVIDGVLFVLGSMFYRSQRARFFRGLRNARGELEALAAIREEFGLEDEPLAIPPEDRARLYRSILALSVHAAPARVKLRRRDIVSAFVVFILVSATALPGVIPFLLLDDSHLAIRVSNVALNLLLFVVGYWWAHYTDARPWRAALVILFLGMAMVSIAVALGG
jgi:hypothetical protein